MDGKTTIKHDGILFSDEHVQWLKCWRIPVFHTLKNELGTGSVKQNNGSSKFDAVEHC